MIETLELKRLNAFQNDLAAQTLAMAFHNDPLMKRVVPDDDERAISLNWLYGRLAEYAYLYGEVFADDDVNGVACWLPSNKANLTFKGVLQTGLAAFPLKFNHQALWRLLSALEYANSIHKLKTSARHWYLWLLGVHPSRQGKGIGAALLAPILARADDEGVECYLETHREENISFYRKHGFELANEGSIPSLGVKAWSMLRKPRV